MFANTQEIQTDESLHAILSTVYMWEETIFFVDAQLNSLDVSIINKGVPSFFFLLVFLSHIFVSVGGEREFIFSFSVALRLLHDESMRARGRQVSRPLTKATRNRDNNPMTSTIQVKTFQRDVCSYANIRVNRC